VNTSWRGALGQTLLAVATALSLFLAFELSGSTPRVAWMSWLLVVAVLGGAVAAGLQLRQLACYRKRLAGGLTHNLRTSLAKIQMYNEMLLLGRERDSEEREEWLSVIGRESERIGAAVENLLLIAGDDGFADYPVRWPVDLGALLEDVACDGCGAQLQFESSPPEGVLVDADPPALRHALGNLIEAIRGLAGPEHGMSAELSSNGATATISVGIRDQEGLVSKQLRKGEATLNGNPAGDDFGLELAAMRHVVRKHGGRAAPFHEAHRSGYRLELPISRGSATG
jgi:K+-sensing histidine kinase KdpD